MAQQAGSAAATTIKVTLPPQNANALRVDEHERISKHMRLAETDSLPFLSPFPAGELPLVHKITPLCQLPEGPEKDSIPLATGRGDVDVGPLLALLAECPAGIWTPEGQASNCAMRRAGHDRWGVGKIMLVFCDDYFTQVFHMPWWHQTNAPGGAARDGTSRWREAVMTILDTLGVQEDRLIRCLLAAMPPGQHIPTHHDTGIWVPRCHRLHVPLVTDPSKVLFSVGYCEEVMQKIKRLAQIPTAVGRCFELNNASKHTVYNGWEQPRVHLIFDYVDDAAQLPASPVLVPSGATLMQTRRSLDIAGAPMKHPIPAFCIIGAQKCGTTSLYDWLCEHPLMVPARRKEPHFLDWRWNPDGAAEGELAAAMLLGAPPAAEPSPRSSSVAGGGADLDSLREQWLRYFDLDVLQGHPSLLTGDATPSYLLAAPLAAPRLRALAPQSRLVVILREPASRALSHFRMCSDGNGSKQQLANRGYADVKGRAFGELVEEDLAALAEAGVKPCSGSASASMDEAFERCYLSSTRLAMQHGGHSFVGRGLYAAQLRPFLRLFGAEQIHVTTLEQLDTSPQKRASLDAAMAAVHIHVGLPPDPSSIAQPEVHNSRGGAGSHAPDTPAVQWFAAQGIDAAPLVALLAERSVETVAQLQSLPPLDRAALQSVLGKNVAAKKFTRGLGALDEAASVGAATAALGEYFRPHNADLVSLLEAHWPAEGVAAATLAPATRESRRATLEAVRSWC